MGGTGKAALLFRIYAPYRGTWPSWNAAVGYQSDKFRVAYYIKPTAF
jgi:hypothetical protein